MAACIPVLHLCQEQHGWVSPDVITYVADRLEMSTSQVKGVVTFYTMYHQEEVAPNVVWVCRTLSCDLRGAKTIGSYLLLFVTPLFALASLVRPAAHTRAIVVAASGMFGGALAYTLFVGGEVSGVVRENQSGEAIEGAGVDLFEAEWRFSRWAE